MCSIGRTEHMAGSPWGHWHHCVSLAGSRLAPCWEKAPQGAAALSLCSQTNLPSLCSQHDSCLPTLLLLSCSFPFPYSLQGTAPKETLLQSFCFLQLL